MSAPKIRCDGCRELKGECVCPPEDEAAAGFLAGLGAQQAALAEAMADVSANTYGEFVRSMMGGGAEPSGAPPYQHVHRLPSTEEEIAAAPLAPTIVVRATKRGTCRHCGTAITHGPRGWRDDENGPLAYGCADAPLGFHEP